eukprot:GHVH01004494.1.p1 GENE.GHVH01004494.1~~GHVH01004494.1.p1  ORF type:complete len:394 (+),score=41.62 GHVH01004494.1:32-1213(+)
MTWRRIPPFTDTAFRLHSNPCVLVTMVENRRPKDDSLAAYLATQLNEAEQKGCLFLLNDLMRCLKKECTSEDFDWVLSERRGTTPPKGKHFWITEAKRATVALKLHEMTKKAPGSDAWTQITEFRSDDVDIDVFYHTDSECGEMTYICNTTINNMSILPVSSLIAEVNDYTKWMPVIGDAQILEEVPRGYLCNIMFESPCPKIVCSRDISMRLVADQDYYRPIVPPQWQTVMSKYLTAPRNGFQMYSESLPDDPALISLLGHHYESLLPNTSTLDSEIIEHKHCQRAYLKHGAAFIRTPLDKRGSPRVKVSLVASVDVFLPRPPAWVIKFIGGKVFEQIIITLMSFAKEISTVCASGQSNWDLAKLFADAIRRKDLYRWMRDSIPESFSKHII